MFRIFKRKKRKDRGPELDEILTEEQIGRIFLFYSKRKKFVNSMMKETNKTYEPSKSYDKNNPNVWKPEYWRWFFGHQYIKD